MFQLIYVKFPHSRPDSRSQCLVMTIRYYHTPVHNRSLTILEESNLTPALWCYPNATCAVAALTFALLLLPKNAASKIYSNSSVIQLFSCRRLSRRRSFFAILSISACQSATEIADFTLISVFLAR